MHEDLALLHVEPFSNSPDMTVLVSSALLRKENHRAAESEEREYHLKVECKRLLRFLNRTRRSSSLPIL